LGVERHHAEVQKGFALLEPQSGQAAMGSEAERARFSSMPESPRTPEFSYGFPFAALCEKMDCYCHHSCFLGLTLGDITLPPSVEAATVALGAHRCTLLRKTMGPKQTPIRGENG
jgi:hypothetical protein